MKLHPAYLIGLAVVAFGLLLFPNSMWGQKERPRKVQDEAKLFSDKAIEEADALIAKLKEKTQKDLLIETVEKGPEKSAAAKWAEKRLTDAGVDGVYIVISKEPRHFEIVIGAKARAKGYFTTANRDEAKKLLGGNLKDNRDEALLKVVKYTVEVIAENAAKYSPRLVNDEAKLFSADAIKDANAIVAKIRDKHQKDLLIETLKEGPADKDKFATWTRERAKKAGVDGVYIMITLLPKHFQVDVDDKTRASGLFTISDRNELAKMLHDGLGMDRDATLLKVANFTLEAMDQRKKAEDK